MYKIQKQKILSKIKNSEELCFILQMRLTKMRHHENTQFDFNKGGKMEI